jgi:hypothetical protein
MRLPKDTDNKIHIEEYLVQNINDLIIFAQEKWGEDVDISKVSVIFEEIQVKCFGYDQYDPADYIKYFILSKE